MAKNFWFRRTPIFYRPSRRPKRFLSRWGGVAWRALKRACMVFGAMILFSFLTSAVFLSTIDTSAPLPDKMTLYMRLSDSFPEYQGNAAYYEYVLGLPAIPTFREAIDAMDAARLDKRVHGLIVMADGGSYSLAQMGELRAAVLRFRKSGKFAHIYAESYDAAGQGLGTYYLASAFDQIWMQPVGSLSIAGLMAEMPFARSLLDKLGVEPAIFARKEYKNVFESFTSKTMSAQTKEVMTALLDDMGQNILAGISEGRSVPPAVLKTQIDRGVLTDKEALEAKLIDRLDYFDILKAETRMKVAGTLDIDAMSFTDFADYAADHRMKDDGKDKPQVALVYAVGQIVSDGESAALPPMAAGLYGGDMSSARDIAQDIEDAARDEDVSVILVRIDSPGGSPTASETIRRALDYAKSKGKQVVVSMGGVAASGGYWIAAPADRIFAMPMTITGSIGVAGGKFVLKKLWDKVGVNWQGIEWGENAGMPSFNEGYDEQGRERMNALMDNIYDSFIQRVAAGRRMTPEAVDKVAGGRVWTGAQALKHGLVDELGGLDAALDHAARLSGVADRHGINVQVLPKPKSPFDELMDMFGMQASLRAFPGMHDAAGAAVMRLMAVFNGPALMTYDPVIVP